MSDDPAKVVSAYFDAWNANDFDTLEALLADDVEFIGPLATLASASDYRKGLQGLSQIKTDIVIQQTFVNGPDVLTWFDLHTSVASPAAVANWMHVENGLIRRTRVTFDPREIIAGS